jgi:Zn finger protein HypA/HybF involved in hydrogenase expression
MAYLYQTCVVLSLLQGISLPFVVIAFRLLSRRHKRKLASLKRRIKGTRGRKPKTTEIASLIRNDLPKLQPLKCDACGSGVLLEETETRCPHCERRSNLPEDYAAAVSLRREVEKLLKSAVRHWRAANILTLPWMIGLFISLGIIEPLLALFLPVIIRVESGVLPGTPADTLMGLLGTPLDGIVYLFWISGIIIWTLLFVCLAVTALDLRKKLSVMPVFEEKILGRETVACHSCGGAIEYDKDDFATICSYCNVENFRVRFTSLKRVEIETQKTRTNFALFGAMEIIENYVTLVYAGTLIFWGFPTLLFILGIMIYGAVNGSFVLLMSAFLVLALLIVLGRFIVSEEQAIHQ